MTNTFPTIPGYQIIKEMGQGGMASVYLAVQESFGRQVALKIMSDQLGKDDVWAKRFMHEARIVAQLSHSNIVPVFDVGSHEGRFYISMELLKGGKLDDKIARGLSIPEIVKIICGVAAGLDYAGSKGFVHRDIKPDNIMFRDDGTPVILDFGIAKQKDGDSKMTKTGTIVGTTGYMSPEQAMGQELDERSDIYSLGIMFYELLTGHVPFRGDSAVSVLLKHVQEAPSPLPGNLATFQPVLDKALAKKPEDRYKRASEMIEHLQDIQAQSKSGANTAQTTVLNSVPAQKTSPKPALGANDATAITGAVSSTTSTALTNNSRMPLFAGVAVIALLMIAGIFFVMQGNKKNSSTLPAPQQTSEIKHTPVVETSSSTQTQTVVEQQPATAVTEEAPVAEKPVEQSAPEETGNKRVVARILLNAHECMKQHKYDCAKSKAESALDIDPDNLVAKKIIANAEKAQQDAFSGDWNAK